MIFRLLGRGGREIAICQAFFEDLPRNFAVQLDALGLMIQLVPAEIQPFQAIENGIDRGFGVAIDIGVINTEEQRAVVVTSVEPVEDERSGAADVQQTGWGRGEADARHQVQEYRIQESEFRRPSRQGAGGRTQEAESRRQTADSRKRKAEGGRRKAE